MKKICTENKPSAKKTVGTRVFDIMLRVTEIVENSSAIIPNLEAEFYIKIVQKMLALSSPEEASLLCVMMQLSFNGAIFIRDIATYYNVKPLEIIDRQNDIDALIKRQVLCCSYSEDGERFYRITPSVMDELRHGRLPKQKDVSDLSPVCFIAETELLMTQYRHDKIDFELFSSSLECLFNSNKKLEMVKCLKRLKLNFTNLLLLLIFSIRFATEQDDEVQEMDFSGYFSPSEFRRHSYLLKSGCHDLMLVGVIEYGCVEGESDNSCWRLSDGFKARFFREMPMPKETKVSSTIPLKNYRNITKKTMFYPPRLDSEIQELTKALKPRCLSRIKKSLEAHGMRKGLCVLFYGGPGTGKTETVLQIARVTGRDIMQVDIAGLRNKYVGESEKNIKAIFLRYNEACKNTKVMPILLFNEADGFFFNRNEHAESSADVMENSLQNIFLEELEHFDGILIATTNLAENFDKAFDRRFIFKMKFDKPGTEVKAKLWRCMLKNAISIDDALKLAERYDFSGGQIENIVRKELIHEVLTNQTELDKSYIIQSCDNELINKHTKIGF